MISVIMPVYDGESHPKEAIDSILNQTFTDFEFLIINDGSTDRSEEIILSYPDDRIKYIHNTVNLGIVKTLNKGIEKASRKYIARMDADDIAMPYRFEKQVAFMEANPDIAASGSNILKLYQNDIQHTKPSLIELEDKFLKIRSLFYTAFWHPTMILRTKVLKDHDLKYRSDYKYTQDKALWIDVSKYGELANLAEPLLYYRVHDKQVSTRYFGEQYAISMTITREALKDIGMDMNSFSDRIVGYIAYPQRCEDVRDLYELDLFLDKSVSLFSAGPNYDTEEVISFMRKQLLNTLLKSQNIGLGLLYYIYKSKYVSMSDFDIKFFIKVLLKRNTKSK